MQLRRSILTVGVPRPLGLIRNHGVDGQTMTLPPFQTRSRPRDQALLSRENGGADHILDVCLQGLPRTAAEC